jgi:hypothetical protein
MVETRIAPRYRVAKPAKIDHGGDKPNCIIRDLSATGAALEIPDIVPKFHIDHSGRQAEAAVPGRLAEGIPNWCCFRLDP